MKDTIPNNTKITFMSSVDNVTLINGIIKGIASIELPVIGRSYIVEVGEDCFPDYPYSCTTVLECNIITKNNLNKEKSV